MVAEVFDFRLLGCVRFAGCVQRSLYAGSVDVSSVQTVSPAPCARIVKGRSAAGPRSTRGARTFPLLPTLAVMAVLAGVSLVILGSLTGSSSTGSSSTCFLWPIPPIIACGFSSSSGQGLAFPALVSVVLMIIFGLFLSTFQWRRSDGELDA